MSNFIINNSGQQDLNQRLQHLIGSSETLKFLVGFFYFSGWQQIYEALKQNPAVRLQVLVGLQVEKLIRNAIEVDIPSQEQSNEAFFSRFMKSLGYAINQPDMDTETFYNQVAFFTEMLAQERLVIRKTLRPNHAKLYLFKPNKDDSIKYNMPAIFITGSSNLTKAGLQDQDEFNVEIKDYGGEEAEAYFDRLWETAIPITETPNGKQVIIDFLTNKSQSALVTPYEAYAYILKTYLDLQETKEQTDDIAAILKANGYRQYQYQIDAVNQALSIIQTYNGVIIADVVGLGKSVIASLIGKLLGKRGLIISPPGLIGDKHDNTGWYGYLNDFKLYEWDIESSGNLEKLAESMNRINRDYEVVIVDEAHRFRNQDTAAYEALHSITRGKQVILLTATPFNNSPADIFSLLKLFIVPGVSGITIENNLEARFRAYNYRFKRLSYILKNYQSKDGDKRRKAHGFYLQLSGREDNIDIEWVKSEVKRMANEIKNVIAPVIIRRNRLDLKKDFEYKKEIQNLSELKDPIEKFYRLSPEQSEFYDKIIQNYFSENGRFTGAIYQPYRYENPKKSDKLSESENREVNIQRNLYDFMRRLLVKRFESSFGAFAQSIRRFEKINKMVLSFIQTSGKYILDRQMIEKIYNEAEKEPDFNLKDIEKTLEKYEAEAAQVNRPKNQKIYDVNSFKKKKQFIKDIENDIKLFQDIIAEIEQLDLVNHDPKRTEVVKSIQAVLSEKSNPVRKVVLFTEYADTVHHLKRYFSKQLNNRVLFCDGKITPKLSRDINANFDAKYEPQEDRYDVLVTTDKLSEGYNLNRAGLVINYDIPWNPTRVIQRVGRINRMSVKVFDALYIYNFFPTVKGADIVKSREIAQQKMFLIHNALGEDAKIFDPDEEPSPSGLYTKLTTNPENLEEVNLLTQIRNIYHQIEKHHPDIIKKISELPNRTKTAKAFTENNVAVLRKKGMALFPLLQSTDNNKILKPQELVFERFLTYVECGIDTPRKTLRKDFWKAYETLKTYEPKYGANNSEIALENKALNSLKSLVKLKKAEIDQDLIAFVHTLIEDIKSYRTLPKYTLRRLVVEKNQYDRLIENIKYLQKQLGKNYLKELLKKNKDINNEVIIAVENINED